MYFVSDYIQDISQASEANKGLAAASTGAKSP